MKKDAIIVDIDGTIADEAGRNIYDLSRVQFDKPIEPIANLIFYYIWGVEDCEGTRPIILFVTGRNESSREVTMQWLERNMPFSFDIDYDDERDQDAFLFMRAEKDNRQDDIVKKEIYENHIKDHYNVLFVLEDRDRVVRMWRNLGLTCLQVKDGNY